MDKILITGGAGFIGSNLAEELLSTKGDCEVICIDNLYTGRLSNIEHLLEKYPNFKFIKGDITNGYWFKSLSELKGVTHVFNAACPASPAHYQGKHAIDTTMVSVIGTKNVLELARREGAKVLQFSTSEVYGDPSPEIREQNEDYRGNVNCTGPRACYDEGKRCAESLCFDYMRVYGINVVVVRIFNTYGPKMRSDDGRVVSNFICQALRGEPITIYGTGNQTRSFCYIDDLVEALVKAMYNYDGRQGPINIGCPAEYKVNELASVILDLIPGSKSEVVYVSLPEDDPTHRRPDINKARMCLEWVPTTSIIRGLVLTIGYFKEELAKEEN